MSFQRLVGRTTEDGGSGKIINGRNVGRLAGCFDLLVTAGREACTRGIGCQARSG